MRKSTIYLFVLGLAVVVTAALASAGLVVSAQNKNASPTMAPTNTGAKKTKPRRHKPKAVTTGTGRCDPTQQEQTDLSGTYKGKATHPDGTVSNDATLTITGNTFSMNAGSEVLAGRITAVTTCGYTAVTMMSGDMTPPTPSPNPPGPNMAVSLRAKKVGDHLTLTSVPGEPRKVSFISAGGGAMKAKPRKHKAKAKATTGTQPTTPPMKH